MNTGNTLGLNLCYPEKKHIEHKVDFEGDALNLSLISYVNRGLALAGMGCGRAC